MAVAILLLAALALGAGGSSGDADGERAPAKALEVPDSGLVEDALPEGTRLTGREIYERYLHNKLHSAVQRQRVVSSDPGGSEQETLFWVRWKDYRAEQNKDDAAEGVLAKTLLRFLEPPDLRNTGYLLIVHEDRSHDQFVYQPSERRVRRVNVKDATVAGTDYSFDDISYQDIEDAEYTRLPDEEIEGLPVYVIEARLKPETESKYSRTIQYLERENFVALRSRYWDRAGVEIKEMRADVSSIKEFGGFWVATRSTMRNLVDQTWSKTEVIQLDPNPDVAEQFFSLFRLQLRHE